MIKKEPFLILSYINFLYDLPLLRVLEEFHFYLVIPV